MDLASRRARIRDLVFSSAALSKALASGEFRSAFKGRGMDFDGLREYGADDDALRIDWNATARLGRPFMKTYREDRNLCVYLVVDESGSMEPGRAGGRQEQAALCAAMVAYACSLNGVLAGGLFFGQGPFEHWEPVSGERSIQAFTERIIVGPQNRSGEGSDLGGALQAALLHLKRRSLVLVISDFNMKGYALPFALLARRHDAAALLIKGQSLPDNLGTIRALDAETRKPRLVPCRSAAYREAYQRQEKAARLEWLSALGAARIPFLELEPESDVLHELIAFFSHRRRRS